MRARKTGCMYVAEFAIAAVSMVVQGDPSVPK